MLSTVSDTESTLNRCYLYTLLITNYNCNNFSKEKPIFTDNLELQAAPLNHAAMEGGGAHVHHSGQLSTFYCEQQKLRPELVLNCDVLWVPKRWGEVLPDLPECP